MSDLLTGIVLGIFLLMLGTYIFMKVNRSGWWAKRARYLPWQLEDEINGGSASVFLRDDGKVVVRIGDQIAYLNRGGASAMAQALIVATEGSARMEEKVR